MTTTLLSARCAPLLFLLACTASPPAAEPVEEWKREALAQMKEFAKQPPDERSSYEHRVAALLEKPDPPAKVGPELKVLPAGDAAIAWPAPKEGVLTVRYRIERKACRSAGADMGCHLVALCPVETPPNTAPAARPVSSDYVARDGFPGIMVEQLEVPSPNCELRLYARDHHGSVVCTARGPKIPAPASGAAFVDIGTIGLDGVACETDELAERMMLRYQLIWNWQRRTAKKKP